MLLLSLLLFSSRILCFDVLVYLVRLSAWLFGAVLFDLLYWIEDLVPVDLAHSLRCRLE